MRSSIETPGRGLHAEGGGDDLEHGFRFARGRELAEPRAIREARQHLGRDLNREAGLADAADTGQREESPFAERTRDLCDILIASDERTDLCRQVARERVQRLQSWEVAEELRMHELEDALGPGEIAEAMLPEVHQVTSSGSESRTSSSVARDTTIWPPWAAAITRAARFTAVPK